MWQRILPGFSTGLQVTFNPTLCMNIPPFTPAIGVLVVAALRFLWANVHYAALLLYVLWLLFEVRPTSPTTHKKRRSPERP